MQNPSHVRLIITLINHGARSPPFPNFNTTSNITDHNHTQGELTNVGRRQLYLLGRAIRLKYVQLQPVIHEHFTDYTVNAYSRPTNAALMSAYSLLMGIYTPGVGDPISELS